MVTTFKDKCGLEHIIRELKEEDNHEAASVIESTKTKNKSMKLDEYKNIFKESGYKFYVSQEEISNKLSGLVSYDDIDKDEIQIKFIYVRSDIQQKNIGKNLYRFVEKIAKNEKFKKISIGSYDLSNKKKFYEDLGFETDIFATMKKNL